MSKLSNSVADNQKIIRFLADNILMMIMVVLVVILTIMSDKFLTVPNILNVLRQVSFHGMIAVGMTMIIVLAQIDLSIGSIVAFGAVVNALLMKMGIPIFPSVIIAVFLSGLWGTLNGWVTAFFNLHAFLVTLATMTLIRGITYTMTGGFTVSGMPQAFKVIGSGSLFGIPLPILYMLVIFAIGILVMHRTAFGRAIYAIGGNAEAARLSGINVERVKVITFSIIAALSGFAGIVVSSRLMAGSPELGLGWELDVIAAVIIGGTSMFGGQGRLTRTFLGVIFVGVLSNGMVLLDVSPYMQQVVKGLVILLAVILNSIKK
ncbi:ribose ABC transporter permease [Marinomonas sp. 15G1-11]|uniref:Ribose ABC transporter permease n=1 Tax=Marinomonas phaeophyticola TaxID=3004091 RepID=A0ABT4JX62_9GAMM|nr:ribose ABC transporter permease [Marinomonas sp. 15G1-11]MCZ2722962.1 ribose ABC transporter permease [Marinomonas sp. 15G1-11]